MTGRVDKVVRRMNDGASLRTRVRAARRLARMATPEAAWEMAKAMTKPHDELVLAVLRRALADLADQACIDEVCRVWNYRPCAELDRLVAAGRWVATNPADLRMRTALFVDRAEELADGDRSVAESLIAIAEGDDRTGRAARAALSTLRGPEAREEVCTAAVAGNLAALDAVVAGGFVPRDPVRHAVLLFLTGRHDEYAALDFDGSLLRAAHAAADAGLRVRLAAAARVTGRLEWVRAVAPGRRVALSNEEWQTSHELLVRAGRWEQLWHLATEAPPVHAVAMLADLAKSGWRPAGDSERMGLAHLAALAAQCARRPLVRRLTDATAQVTVTSLAVSADGGLLAVGENIRSRGGAGRIALWRLPSGASAGYLDPGRGSVDSLAMTPDDRLLVSGGDAGVQLWQRPSGAPDHAWRANEPAGFSVGHLAITPDGRLLVSAGNGIAVRALPSGQTESWLMPSPWAAIDDLALSPDGSAVAVLQGDVHVWELPSGRYLGARFVPTQSAQFVVGHGGQLLAAGGKDGSVRLWKIPAGAPELILNGLSSHPARVAISPDGSLLAGATGEGTVRLWRLPSGEPAGVPQERGPEISSLIVTPDGRLLVAASERDVRLWRLPAGEFAGVLPDSAGGARLLTASADGTMLAGVVGTSEVRVWLLGSAIAAYAPVAHLGMPVADRLRSLLGHSAVAQPWIELVLALVARRHRYDIEVDGAPAPAGSDIEISG